MKIRRRRLLAWTLLGLMTAALAGAAWFAWSVLGLGPFADNLTHPDGTVTARLGELSGVRERGHGDRDVVLIPGLGFGTAVFDRFMASREDRYRMVTAPLPGFGGTPPPPLPPPGTSYGDLTWTRAAADAFAAQIRDRRLQRPVLAGFFTGGAHVALWLALEHPDLVAGVVVIGADSRRILQTSFGGRRLSYQERVDAVDGYWGPWIFGKMRPAAFRANVFPSVVYSHDETVGEMLVRESRQAPLPTFVQYLAEHMASDIRRELDRLQVPVTVLQPGFDDEVFASVPGVRWVFWSWDEPAARHDLVILRRVEGSRAAVMVDRPEAVDRVIGELAGRQPEDPARP